MVAISQTPETMPKVQIEPREAIYSLLAASMRFVGAVMILSAVGIWLVPAIAGDGMVVLMKLVASVFFGCVGSVLVQWGRDTRSEEIHMDTEARELTHVQRFGDGIPRLRARYRFDELADIRMSDGKLQVIGHDGAVLVRTGLMGAPAKTA
jgi:hypothetical protein